MKKIRWIPLLLAVLILVGPVAPNVQAAGADTAVTAGCNSPDAAVPLSSEGQLLDTAQSVILYDLNSDTMIYAYNPDLQVYPASLVRLMAVMVAIEHADLTDEVVVSQSALMNMESDAIVFGLRAGERLSLESLLYLMIVSAANDPGPVVAEHVAGSQVEFAKLMNEKAAELGCTGTHFTNAHGLHDPNNYTTARDLLRITKAALEIPLIRKMFESDYYIVPATNYSNERTAFTSNYMLSNKVVSKYYDARLTGGKTGATEAAGRCLVATSEGNGMRLLSVVMGTVPTYEEGTNLILRFGSFEETAALLDFAYARYEYRQLFYTNQVLTQMTVAGGANAVTLTPAQTIATVLPISLDESLLVYEYNREAGLTAPIMAGSQISPLEVWYDSVCLGTTELLAMYDVPRWGTPQEAEPAPEEEEEGSWGLMLLVLGVLLAIALIAVLMMIAVRWVRMALIRARRRRRHENRRRSR